MDQSSDTEAPEHATRETKRSPAPEYGGRLTEPMVECNGDRMGTSEVEDSLMRKMAWIIRQETAREIASLKYRLGQVHLITAGRGCSEEQAN